MYSTAFSRAICVLAVCGGVFATRAAEAEFQDPLTYAVQGRQDGQTERQNMAKGVVFKKRGEITTPYLQATASPTRPWLLLNGVWELSNAAKLPFYNPLDDKQFPDPLAPFADPPLNEQPPGSGWQKVLIPSSAGHMDNAPTYLYGLDWYRRTFAVPAAWQGQRVLLEFGSLFYEVVLYVNGRHVAWTRIDRTPWIVDITDFVRYGDTPNELCLRIRYAYTPYGQPWQNAFVGAVRSKRDGILDDVFLLSRPTISTRDVFIKTQFRKKNIEADIEIRNDRASNETVRVQSRVTELTGAEVLQLPARTVALKPGEAATVTLAADWNEPRLWNIEHPNLYLLETRLSSAGGAQLLDVHKERFGFREIWIENGQFKLNGCVIHFNQYTAQIETSVPDRRDTAAHFRKLKALGYNLFRYFDKPFSMNPQVADEVGLYLNMQSGWHHPLVKMNPVFKADADIQVPRWIRQYRNHPSALMWASENEAYNSLIESRKYVFDLIRKTDPTRPIDTEGGFYTSLYDENGAVRTGRVVDWMEIINPHYPISITGYGSMLSSAEHPLEWARTKPKPLFYGEWGLNAMGNGRYSRPACYHEDLFHTTLQDFDPNGWPMTMIGVVENMEFIMPYWIRCGVGGQCNHSHHTVELSPCQHPPDVQRPGQNLYYFIPILWDRMDAIGSRQYFMRYFDQYTVNAGLFPDLPEFELTELQKRFARIFRPFYAFFLDSTYAVYGGHQFNRTLCVLNRSSDPAPRPIKGMARLVVGGKVVATTPLQGTAPQGSHADIAVEFALPEVVRKTPATIDVTLDLAEGRWGSRPLRLALFPERPAPSKAKVLLYDPLKSTAQALGQAGIAFRAVNWPNEPLTNAIADTLVIGQGGLDRNIAAKSAEILQFVEAGGRVVCLAQSATNTVKWLPMILRWNRKHYNQAVVITALATEGILAGLDNDDVSFWPTGRDDPGRIPGCVVRSPYEKPEAGRVRSLLECGEDFDRSALLECRFGKGVVYLSQLEIVPVAGISPVADLLLQRLITSPLSLPAERVVWYTGHPDGLALLKNDLGIDARALSEAKDRTWSESDLIVCMPGTDSRLEASQREQIRAALGNGAALAAFAPQQGALDFLSASPIYGQALQYKAQPYVLHPTKRELDEYRPGCWQGPGGPFIKMALLDHNAPLVTGLSDAETYRFSMMQKPQKLADFEIEPTNGWQALSRPAVLAWRRQGRSTQLICTAVKGDELDTNLKYRRMVWTLLINLGAAGTDPKVALMGEMLSGDRKFSFVDLRFFCNMGFKDETAGDRKGGFSDQGERDLRGLPVGKQTWNDIPFDVIDPATHAGKSCINLGFERETWKKHNWLPHEVRKILVERKARYVYFLHTSSYTPEGELGHYLARYPASTEQTRKIPITSGVNITDWESGVQLSDAQVAWAGISGIGAPVRVYMCQWKNPLPDIPIESIDFVGEFRSSLGLIAITLEE